MNRIVLNVQRNVWINLSVDIEKYNQLFFPNCEYKKIHTVTVFPYCRLKSFYIAKESAKDIEIENASHIANIQLPRINLRKSKDSAKTRPVSVLSVKRRLSKRAGTADCHSILMRSKNTKSINSKQKNSFATIESKAHTNGRLLALNGENGTEKKVSVGRRNSSHSVKHSSLHGKENIAANSSAVQTKNKDEKTKELSCKLPLMPKKLVVKHSSSKQTPSVQPPISFDIKQERQSNTRYSALELLKEAQGGHFNSFQILNWDKESEEDCVVDEIVEEIPTKRNESGKKEFKGVSLLYARV
eukprot:TRINITY_DN301_c0_g5_i2.p1 TRINITY_DN301_c0_g5~~TRINITY_DN301_c0_g5_i2.p1  ORF type:complete len:300 (+),score=62.93 TRINITY_DN301_c0_g5_i2:484-1383(+)